MVLDFSVEMVEQDQIPLISINGEIDVYNAPKLHEYFSDIVKQQHKLIVVNLENVQYIDSTGLGTIAQVAHSLSQHYGKMNVVCTRPSIKKIFEVSGLIRKNITLFDSNEGAFESAKQLLN